MPQQPGSESSIRRKKLDLRSKLLPPRFRRASSDDAFDSPTSPDAAGPTSNTDDQRTSPRSLNDSARHHARQKSAEAAEAEGERVGAGAARALQERVGLQEVEKPSATVAAQPASETTGTSSAVVNGVDDQVEQKTRQDRETTLRIQPSPRVDADSISPTSAVGPGRLLPTSSSPRADAHPRVTIEGPSPPVPAAAAPASPLYPTSPGGENEQQAPRKQSIAYSHDHRLVRHLFEQHRRGSSATDHAYTAGTMALDRAMVHRKIWVKRTGASATLVQITEDDLVDDVREMILKKYANSLGRSFDAPDVTLRIVSREHSHSHRHAPVERTLGPEEHMTRTLDTYYPGGQTVDEALIIDVPIVRRTPRHSPQVPMPYYSAGAEDMRPAETDLGYFPPVMQQGAPSPSSNLPPTSVPTDRHQHHHSISVLSTGMIPPLPSPGSRARSGHRPRLGRNNTASPTVATAAPSFPDNRSIAPNPPTIPTPPPISQAPTQRTSTPPPRTQSPRPAKQKRPSKKNTESSSRGGPLLDGTVPPINVLIVEDNIINLKLLEAFMKRLKVRWHTAMNGRDAVKKWKEGGFHLVLMDIQLPIMSGLEATKEIRRLERCNGVGVLAASERTASADEPIPDKDQLPDMALFKSSVIIVALTASSLQSDRHEALAAGCNDFLTKPVNFVWLERKVTEWGCMQALIDFDGWRAWKELPVRAGVGMPFKPKSEAVPSSARNRTSPLIGHGRGHASATTSETTASRAGANHSGYGSSASPPSSEHSGSGQPQPEVQVQAPTPPTGPTGPTVPPSSSPRITTGGFDGASSGRRPSPLTQSSSSATSPPMKPSSPVAGRISPGGHGRTSPSPSRISNGTGSGASAGAGAGANPPMSPREREYEGRRAKRASFGLGVTNGRLSGVTEELDDTVPQGETMKARRKERELGRVGA